MLLQGYPIFAFDHNASESFLMDLAGNAYSTTVMAAVILSSFLAIDVYKFRRPAFEELSEDAAADFDIHSFVTDLSQPR
jgi:hypothetical protein